MDWPVEHAPVSAIVIHHTGTTNDDPDPLAMVRRVQRFHTHDRGWGDIGYSFIVLEDGRIVEGRAGSADAIAPDGAIGGHTYGHNPGSIGVAVAGRFHDRAPTAAAWDALVDLVATIGRTCDLDLRGGPVTWSTGAVLAGVISGHRDARDTSCPGDALAALLPDLRSAAASAIGGAAAQNAG